MAGLPERIDLLQFMSVRSPEPLSDAALARRYIADDVVISQPRTHLADDDGGSQIARLVVQEVFCTRGSSVDGLVDKLIALLPVLQVDCEGRGQGPRALGLRALEGLGAGRRFDDSVWRVVPDRLAALGLPGADSLSSVRRLLERTAKTRIFDRDKLLTDIAAVFSGARLVDVAFEGVGGPLFLAKRKLFDALYLLYILRRRIVVNLEEVISALQTLHALEYLAMDAAIEAARSKGVAGLDPGEARSLGEAQRRVPALGRGDFDAVDTVSDAAGLLQLLGATPIVHPIFAQLHYYAHSFNPVRPLGVGDLKVVKQWLVEYVPGEIASITNVLAGESNQLVRRRLDRTVEVFATFEEQSSETATEHQATDRFELKREAEAVLKTDLQIRAETSLKYDNKIVQIGVSGGFAYGRSTEDASKSAQQLAREIVDKSVTRVQSRTSQQRSITKIYEDEKTETHTFTATDDHVVGFYRYLDKRYKAQLFNYGKRLMFEFIIPEPAAFVVESRLRGFETSLVVPQPPSELVPELVKMPYSSDMITKKEWNDLRKSYDLSSVPAPPPATLSMPLVDKANSQALFMQRDLKNTDDNWWAIDYEVQLPEGYEVVAIKRNGTLRYVWWHSDPENQPRHELNLFNTSLDGRLVLREDDTARPEGYRSFYSTSDDIDLAGVPHRVRPDGKLTLRLEFQNLKEFFFTFTLELALTQDALAEWQMKVFNAVRAVEQAHVDAHNREAQMAHDAAVADYRRDIAALTKTTQNAVLKGTSETANSRIIETEIKRLCVAQLTKEFDADPTDDRLSRLEAMGNLDLTIAYRQLIVGESEDGLMTVRFDAVTKDVSYPAIKLDEARRKGRYVQFVEQAFEWNRIGYLFYPYFWATPPKWIDLLSRTDDADSNWTAFLQAGSARVVVAASPGYEGAILHYLATGEPWEGGPSPVIGDSLYVPLYDEIRDQQDDLAGATPEGKPWPFLLPTNLIYLDGGAPIPTFPQDPPPAPH